MKQLGWAILVLLIIHLLAVGGGVAWLGSTGRINQARVQAVVDTFKQPIAAEEAEAAKAAALELEARTLAERAAKLEGLAEGPQTLNDRLSVEELKDELAMHRLERLKRETDDLRQQIERAQEIIAKQKSQLQAERRAFEEFVAQTTTQLQEEDFQRAVQMYEQLKPKQAKQMFQQLLDQGESERVVQYLTAMQLRKSAAVLKEFKSPEEVVQATAIIEELRKRGVYADDVPAMAGATP